MDEWVYYYDQLYDFNSPCVITVFCSPKVCNLYFG